MVEIRLGPLTTYSGYSTLGPKENSFFIYQADSAVFLPRKLFDS
jgi:hypothetical protein